MTAESRAGGLAEDSALRALADALDVRLGLALPPGDPSTIARRLRHRIRERAFGSVVEYAEYLIHGATETAWDELAETLTANESRIFEAPQDFLPLFELSAGARWGRYARGAAEEPFRALSAGSGTGEEAYSIGMALAEATQGAPAFRFEVVGVDLSRQAVAAAREGAYPESRFGSLPPELGERHFVRAGDGRVPIGELRRRVRFGRVNLADEDALVPLGAFDLAFARGVLPALTPRARRVALGNLAGTLKPSGILLLGPGELLLETDLGIHPVRWGDRHAYERPGPAGPPQLPEEDRVPEPATALVAHRSPLLQQWLSLLLTRRGYRVETAADGVEALTLAAYGRPRSLYWLERALPPDGGAAVASRLRAAGVADFDRVLLLSPRDGSESAPEDGEEWRVLPVPLGPSDRGYPPPGTDD